MTRIVAFGPFLEFVAGAAGASEVVARGAAQGPPPRALGARMTVVTLTPSNYNEKQIYFLLLIIPRSHRSDRAGTALFLMFSYLGDGRIWIGGNGS